MKKMLPVILIVISVIVSAKDYYFKQDIITPNTFTGNNDTLTQETFIMKDLVVIKDEYTIQFSTDKAFHYYNLVDSTYFTRNSDELEMLAIYADEQFQGFSISPSGEKSKIGKWEVEKYNATAKAMGMEMSMDLYISKDTGIPVGIPFKQQEKMSENAKNMKKMFSDIKNTGGIVLKEVARIQGTVTSTKITREAKEIKAPEGIKVHPKGFKEMKK